MVASGSPPLRVTVNSVPEILYVLSHREHGPISTFTSLVEAKAALNEVLRDEPEWTGDFTIEPFAMGAADAPTRPGE